MTRTIPKTRDVKVSMKQVKPEQLARQCRQDDLERHSDTALLVRDLGFQEIEKKLNIDNTPT